MHTPSELRRHQRLRRGPDSTLHHTRGGGGDPTGGLVHTIRKRDTRTYRRASRTATLEEVWLVVREKCARVGIRPHHAKPAMEAGVVFPTTTNYMIDALLEGC